MKNSEKNAKHSGGKTLLKLIKDTKPIRKIIYFTSFLTLISIGLSLYAPKIMGDITQAVYDAFNGVCDIDLHAVLIKSLILGGMYCLSCVISIITMRIMNRTVTNHYTCDIRKRMSEKIKHLSVGYLDKTPNGEIISRMMHDVSTMGNTVHGLLDMFLSGFIKLTVITVIIFVVNPIMAVCVAVIVPLSLLLAGFLSSKCEKYFNTSREYNGNIYALCQEDFSCFDTVKAFNLERKQSKKMNALLNKWCSYETQGFYRADAVRPIISFFNNIAYILICLIGGLLSANGILEVGAIVMFILYAKMYAGPLESIANGLGFMQNTLAAAGRVYSFLEEDEMQDDEAERLPFAVQGNVEFKNVYFSYDKEKPFIENLSFSALQGQKIAIVGPTGGGKTTLVNLIMRFYEIDKGEILLDGQDVSKISKSELRSYFAMVLQDTWLFSGTIMENVRYGRPSASDEEVKNACKKAHIDGYIESLPDGYDTVINEETTNISGGQKQLLTIARAYLSNRKMLILDEATSNVDTRTELLIQRTMDELMKDKTSFVIAHRLSTIIDADVILVVNKGSIVEVGTHKSLMEKGGFYFEIYNSQYDLLK